MAKIELLPGSVARKKRPFRMPEERKMALKIVLDKLLDNGWIEPSQSDWCAQAFLVPKLGDKNNPGVKSGRWLLITDI